VQFEHIPKTMDGYRRFLRIKQLPSYRFSGSVASYADEYAGIMDHVESDYQPSPFAFDYQADGVRMSLAKKKFALFADCGLGKSLIYFEYARHLQKIRPTKSSLIITPSMVVPQMLAEFEKFYGEKIIAVSAANLASWLAETRGEIAVTNWEALKQGLNGDNLASLILDESSVLKSHYGKYGQAVIELGAGVEFKLCGTGTPAPNDRIEYANHAVFLDRFPTVNSFLARYFINRGQTQERWALKPHALKPFYRSLADWSIFLVNPATYGWKDNCATLPPIHVHIHDLDMTESQNEAVRNLTGKMFATDPGGITSRSAFSRIAKGIDGQETVKYEFIRSLVDSWPGESTIIWCWYNTEQDILEKVFPDAASIQGATPMDKRIELIDDFKAGRRKVLISKPKVLGFGLNLQIATRQVFSSLIDSYEQYYQAVKRSNRIGSTKPLNVHIPILDVERPMVETVLSKASMVMADTLEQERIFKELASEVV
jgi:hypothetical protein